MASRLLAPLIEAFRAKYPELRVDLIMTDRRLDLAKGEAEVDARMVITHPSRALRQEVVGFGQSSRAIPGRPLRHFFFVPDVSETLVFGALDGGSDEFEGVFGGLPPRPSS